MVRYPIPTITPNFHWHTDFVMNELLEKLDYWKKTYPLFDLDPDYQRPFVWSHSQDVAYIEWVLKGGHTGRDFWFSHSKWDQLSLDVPFELVDGKQRLNAITRFVKGEFSVFDNLYGRPLYFENVSTGGIYFTIHVCQFKNRAEILKWYLAYNVAGEPHTQEEINRVKKLLEQEQ
jgi:hypothetical protein